MDQKEQEKLNEAAKSLNKAMKGLGTDEDRIIREILPYNIIQRQMIKNKYKLLSKKDLIDDLNSELSGHFREAVIGLFTPVDEFEASILRKAIKGLGTDESKVIEILCTKNAEEIKKLKSAYRKLYRRELDADIKDEESGDLGRLIRSLTSAGRAQNYGYDIEFVTKEAENLYNAGQGKIGTNEKEFIRILCTRSFSELSCINAIYAEKYGKDLARVIREEFSGYLRDALIAIAKCAVYKAEYFAELLYTSFRRDDDFETDVLQIVIRRVDIDLDSIKAEFKKKYQISLSDAIKKETNGDFRKLMLALLNEK